MPITAQRLKVLRSLGQKKFRDEKGVFLAEGLRLVRDAAAADAPVVEVFHTPDFAGGEEGRALLNRFRGRAEVTEVRARDLEAFTDAVTAQGIAALVKKVDRSDEELLRKGGPPSLLVALDAISDPGNLGTLIRTCDWFGVDGLLVGKDSVEVHNPKVVRATMGGIFRLHIAERVGLHGVLSRARGEGYQIYASALEGGSEVESLRPRGKRILVLGSEARGISEPIAALAHHRVTIRRYGAGESLNVGVACGVLLAAFNRHRT